MKKTIGSVSEMTEKDCSVVFTKTGGAVFKDPGERIAKAMVARAEGVTGFKREKRVYVLDMWMRREEGADEKCSQTLEKLFMAFLQPP